jgi:hypothetical protein
MERSLGAVERIFWIGREFAPLNCVITAHVDGRVSADTLVEILARVQARHALLQVRIVNSDGLRFTSAGVGSIAVRVVESSEPDSWGTELQHELDRRWHGGPLLNVTLVHSPHESAIICTYHHVIGDGICGLYMMREILTELTGRAHHAARLHEPPPLEALVPRMTSSLGKMLVMMPAFDVSSIRGAAGRFVRTLPGVLATTRRMRDEITGDYIPNMQSRFMQYVLPPDATQALAARSRQERTTVHGALCAAVALSVVEQPPHSSRVLLGSPINARRFLSQDVGESFALYTTGVATSHKVAVGTNFWDIARDVKRQLDDMTNRPEELHRRILAAERLPHVRNPLLRVGLGWIASGFREFTYVVSNLGRFDATDEVLRDVRGLHACVSPTHDGRILAALTFRGSLICNFTNADPYTSAATARALSRNTMEHLRAAIA